MHAQPAKNVDVSLVPAQSAGTNAQPAGTQATQAPPADAQLQPTGTQARPTDTQAQPTDTQAQPTNTQAQQRGTALFRLHTAEHEVPAARRVLGLTFWAAISIFIGLIPAGRLFVSVTFSSSIFAWYPVAAASLGVLGLILMTSAFAAIHRPRLPWYLMTIATFLLAVNVAMVYLIPLTGHAQS